jgi:hypothetical protein
LLLNGSCSWASFIEGFGGAVWIIGRSFMSNGSCRVGIELEMGLCVER